MLTRDRLMPDCFAPGVTVLLLTTGLLLCSTARAQDAAITPDEALTAMKKAAQFFHDKVAVRGGYVYYYSTDLKHREGEGDAAETEIWVQPPGTPTVGMAFLDAWKATGEREFLDAAVDAAGASGVALTNAADQCQSILLLESGLQREQPGAGQRRRHPATGTVSLPQPVTDFVQPERRER